MSEQFSDIQNLRTIIENKTFRIPLYQRNYKWNENVAGQLAKDLLKAYPEDKVKSVGLITLYKKDDKEEIYDVIDGQQRLITLSVLLTILGCPNKIKIIFDRDNDTKIRKNALNETGNIQDRTTDTDRIARNRKAMEDVLPKEYVNNAFAEFILDKCSMLCSIMKNPPIEEFMNLNAYKTAFSVCDYVRSNLIMLNTFYKEELTENITDILGGLSRYTYKTAVAELYNNILDILYSEKPGEGSFKSPYKVLFDADRFKGVRDVDKFNESRINILFEVNKGSQGYHYDPGNKDFSEWKQELIRLSWIYRLLKRLKEDMEAGDFSAAKAIDNYEKLKGKSFISLLLKLNQEDKDLSLSGLLNKYSNVNNVLMSQITGDDLKLANRYFEAFASAGKNSDTNNSAETSDICITSHMSEDEIINSISSAGRYVLDRFLTEQHYETDSTSIIPPILDLNDNENNDLGGNLADINEKDNTITVGDLFKNVIKIPVIQRDYCMGAQFKDEDKNNFLSYLIERFENSPDKFLNISTILVSKEKNRDAVYIFDGQQRTFTLYQILKYFRHFDENHKGFEFIGRCGREYGSSYSEKAVENLKDQLDFKLKDFNQQKKEEFVRFLLNNIRFTVKQIGDVSSAEQFFMDINGGVALEPYEIFKSCLYDRIKEIDHSFTDRFMHLLENEWLNAIYKLLDIEQKDDSDKEEITEIRLIEFICRYLYKDKTQKKAYVFDVLSSKSTVVEKAREYLGEMELDDFKKVEKFMNYFMDQIDHDYVIIAQIITKPFNIDSYGNSAYLCKVTLKENNVQNKDIISAFVKSFSPDIRDKLLSFYSCEAKWLIENIYDYDELADLIIKIVLDKPEPTVSYFNSTEIAEATFVGGYQVRNIKNGDSDSYKIYEKEIPAYYADMSNNSFKNTIRPHYLYHYLSEKKKNVSFFLTKNEGSIKHPNDKHTMFLLSVYKKLEIEQRKCNNQDEYWIIGELEQQRNSYKLTNRTDAYRLSNRDTKNFLLNLKK